MGGGRAFKKSDLGSEMMRTQTSDEHPRSNGGNKAQDCRRLAMKAGKQAAQASDADIRTTFLSMRALWLDLADEIDRRQRGP
jgi:hypothetical protein